jgi:hypothetical protein
MFQIFANPWMLTALAGVALPILAHLLSRRRFDVVEWGAMQFLNPSRKTRRRLKLEELLLLLLRIGIIAALVFAATRPMLPSGWWSGYRSSGSRTVVLVIDGSNSMARSDGVNSVHRGAIRRATEFLQTLGADDHVALVDARDQPRSVIESPLRDLAVVEEQLKALPDPGGSCAMVSAIEKAIAILGRSSSSAREVVVFTDQQANGWHSDKDPEWNRIDDLLKFPAVRPKIWCVDVTSHLKPSPRNVAVGRIQLSREMTVPDFPIRLSATVRNESDTELQIPIRLVLDGQTLAGEQQTLTVSAKSEAALEFSHAIRQEGTHVLSIAIESQDDAISVDNISHAAIQVASSLPVLLVNGTATAIPAERDTFFAELAFSPQEGNRPWIDAKVLDAAELQPESLNSVTCAVLCNVGSISPQTLAALANFVQRGNGLIVTCGQNLTAESFMKSFVESGILPKLELLRTRDAPPQTTSLVQVAPLSMQPGWLDRFRSDPARSFLKASYGTWAQFKLTSGQPTGGAAIGAVPSTPPIPGVAGIDSIRNAGVDPIVLAQLNSGDPLILEVPVGDGRILLFTSTLNRSWNDLPTRSDFVPFLHEAVFHVASPGSRRNVDFGSPLLMSAPSAGDDPNGGDANNTSEFYVTPPGGQDSSIVAQQNAAALTAAYSSTFVPGVYRTELRRGETASAPDAFVVNYDHDEDRYLPISRDDQARLATNDRVHFANSMTELTQRMYGQESVTELWAFLMIAFLLFLVAELLLTRRTIRRGYGGEALDR